MTKMVSLKDFAASSGLSVWAIRLLVAEGKLPAVRVGAGRGRIFLPVEQAALTLAAMAAENTPRAVEPVNGIRKVNG